MKEIKHLSREWIEQYLTLTPLRVAVGLYALACIPTYSWLEGSVGFVGTVPASTALSSLVLGSILVVPLVTYVVNQRFFRGGRTDG